VEVGFVYFGEGQALLNFAGSACSTESGTLYCQNTTGYPEFQQNVLAEQTKIQNDLDYARFYPIVRMELTYKF
jgi:hypothetical protein